MTKQQIIEAIQDYFGETTRPASQTLDDLEEIRDECQLYIDSLSTED